MTADDHSAGVLRAATGDGPPPEQPRDLRRAEVRAAWAGMVEARRVANAGQDAPENVPAPWERLRPVRAIALLLEAAGFAPSATDSDGARTATGYRVMAADDTGASGTAPSGAAPSGTAVVRVVRIDWLGPRGSGAQHRAREELGRCAVELRRWGWTALEVRGERGGRYLEVEPPARSAARPPSSA